MKFKQDGYGIVIKMIQETCGIEIDITYEDRNQVIPIEQFSPGLRRADVLLEDGKLYLVDNKLDSDISTVVKVDIDCVDSHRVDRQDVSTKGRLEIAAVGGNKCCLKEVQFQRCVSMILIEFSENELGSNPLI